MEESQEKFARLVLREGSPIKLRGSRGEWVEGCVLRPDKWHSYFVAYAKDGELFLGEVKAENWTRYARLVVRTRFAKEYFELAEKRGRESARAVLGKMPKYDEDYWVELWDIDAFWASECGRLVFAVAAPRSADFGEVAEDLAKWGLEVLRFARESGRLYIAADHYYRVRVALRETGRRDWHIVLKPR